MIPVKRVMKPELLTWQIPTDLASNHKNYPIGVEGLVATVLQGVPIFCAGAFVTDCYTYNPQSYGWEPAAPMVEPRFYAAGDVVLGGSQWWITGGRNGNSNEETILDNTEFVVEPQGDHLFNGVQALPMAMEHHCLISIDATRLFLAGGTTRVTDKDTTQSNKTYIIDLANSEGWQELPDRPIDRSSMACFKVETEQNGPEIVLMSGTGREPTDIFSLTSLTWRAGPNFPYVVFWPTVVGPYKDSYLVMGGFSGSNSHDEIYWLNTTSDPWTWIQEASSLTNPQLG